MTEFNRPNVLRVLADVLEEEAGNDAAKVAGFNMASFVKTPQAGSFREDETEMVLESGMSPTLCGTQLCVAGFATLARGWKFKFTKRTPYMYGDYFLTNTTYINPQGVEQNGEPDWELEGRLHMGISSTSAAYLFYATFDDGETAIEMLEEMVRLNRDLTHEEISEINIAGRKRADPSYGEPYDYPDEDEDEYEDSDYCCSYCNP